MPVLKRRGANTDLQKHRNSSPQARKDHERRSLKRIRLTMRIVTKTNLANQGMTSLFSGQIERIPLLLHRSAQPQHESVQQAPLSSFIHRSEGTYAGNDKLGQIPRQRTNRLTVTHSSPFMTVPPDNLVAGESSVRQAISQPFRLTSRFPPRSTKREKMFSSQSFNHDGSADQRLRCLPPFHRIVFGHSVGRFLITMAQDVIGFVLSVDGIG